MDTGLTAPKTNLGATAMAKYATDCYAGARHQAATRMDAGLSVHIMMGLQAIGAILARVARAVVPDARDGVPGRRCVPTPMRTEAGRRDERAIAPRAWGCR